MRYRVANRLIEAVLLEGQSLNVATTPLAKARQYAESLIDNLDDVLPNFDTNYQYLQRMTRDAMPIRRIDMPVIEPTDMDRFKRDLQSGHVDIFQPYAKGRLEAPTDLGPGREAEEWLTLGVQDGNLKDDVVRARMAMMPVTQLLPTQNQIWLEKLIGNIAKFGPPTQGSSVTQETVIVSQEGYILDGHHRFGQAMLANPSLKLKALFVPMDIRTLLQIGRTYGNAIGNQQKA